ncbi:MAG TPA: regulatory protein RecX [Sphingomicrobium sp.]|nr:regulatory protein RecX [Sphingomicrobium sp.]
MRGRKRRREPRPLDSARLDELALTYVGRFATTRAKLGSYLSRKIRERGWAGEQPPVPERIVERLAELGYVDDAQYALSKARSLTGRGYGPRRVSQSLHAAGIGEEDGEAARELAGEESVEAALHYARRRRIGPYAAEAPDPAARERALAAMIRAGHSFGIAKAILSLKPGEDVNIEMLEEKS